MVSTNLLRAQRRRAELEEQQAQREQREQQQERQRQLLLEQQQQQQQLQQQLQQQQEQQRRQAAQHVISSPVQSPKRGQRFSRYTEADLSDGLLEASPATAAQSPRSPSKRNDAQWGAAAAREQQIAHEAQLAELQVVHEAQLAELRREHAEALARAMAVAAGEAQARALAEDAAEDAQRRAEAADELASRAAEEAQNAAKHFAEDARQRSEHFEHELQEREHMISELNAALAAAEEDTRAATARAEEAEAAALSAADAARSARDVAQREVGIAAAAQLSALQTRCERAEAQLSEEQLARAYRLANQVEVGCDPVPALLLAEQAEASRHQVALHELKVLTQAHETAQRQYAELSRRAAVLHRRASRIDSDGEEEYCGDGIDGWHNGVEAVEKASDSVQLAGAMAERERRHRLAQTMLAWFLVTRKR